MEVDTIIKDPLTLTIYPDQLETEKKLDLVLHSDNAEEKTDDDTPPPLPLRIYKTLHFQCPRCEERYSNEAGAWTHYFLWHDEDIKISTVRTWRWEEAITTTEDEEVRPRSISTFSCDDKKTELSNLTVSALGEEEEEDVLELCDKCGLMVNLEEEELHNHNYEFDVDETQESSTLETTENKNDIIIAHVDNQPEPEGTLQVPLPSSPQPLNVSPDKDNSPINVCPSPPPPDQNQSAMENEERRTTHHLDTTKQCDQCCEMVRKNNYIKHSLMHENASLPCDQCAGRFAKKYQLQHHMERAHHHSDWRAVFGGNKKSPQAKVPCSECSEVLLNSQRYRKHKRMHKKEGRLSCPEGCKGKFPTNSRLVAHMRIAHSHSNPGARGQIQVRRRRTTGKAETERIRDDDEEEQGRTKQRRTILSSSPCGDRNTESPDLLSTSMKEDRQSESDKPCSPQGGLTPIFKQEPDTYTTTPESQNNISYNDNHPEWILPDVQPPRPQPQPQSSDTNTAKHPPNSKKQKQKGWSMDYLGETKQCTKCCEIIQTSQYKKHFSVHKNASFKCAHCGGRFAVKARLGFHMKKVHYSQYLAWRAEYDANRKLQPQIPCSECTEVLDNAHRYKRHKKMHNNKRKGQQLSCPKGCKGKFPENVRLETHLRLAHNAPPRGQLQVEVETCGKEERVSDEDKADKDHCDPDTPSSCDDEKTESPPVDNPAANPTLVSSSVLGEKDEVHMRKGKTSQKKKVFLGQVRTTQCTGCCEILKNNVYDRHLLVHTNASLPCAHCGGRFVNKYQLGDHMKRAHYSHYHEWKAECETNRQQLHCPKDPPFPHDDRTTDSPPVLELMSTPLQKEDPPSDKVYDKSGLTLDPNESHNNTSTENKNNISHDDKTEESLPEVQLCLPMDLNTSIMKLSPTPRRSQTRSSAAAIFMSPGVDSPAGEVEDVHMRNGEIQKKKKVSVRQTRTLTLQCTGCCEMIKKTVYKQHLIVHTNASLSCSHCGGIFAKEYQLCQHMQRAHYSHYLKWKAECEANRQSRQQYGSEVLENAGRYKRHSQNNKNKKSTISCPEGCKGKFPSSSRLETHLRIGHNHNEPTTGQSQSQVRTSEKSADNVEEQDYCPQDLPSPRDDPKTDSPPVLELMHTPLEREDDKPEGILPEVELPQPPPSDKIDIGKRKRIVRPRRKGIKIVTKLPRPPTMDGPKTKAKPTSTVLHKVTHTQNGKKKQKTKTVVDTTSPPRNYMKCEQCCEIIMKSCLNKHLFVHDNASLPCPHCHGRFAKSYQLGIHMRRAHYSQYLEEAKRRRLPPQVPCSECTEILNVKKFTRHMQIHKNGPTVSCPEGCSGKFPNNHRLEIHLRIGHNAPGRVM